MSRTIIMFAASAIVGIASVALVSTDALAAKKVRQPAASAAVVAPAHVYAATGIDNNYGPVATRIPKCIDSVIFYPVPPCY